MDAFDRQLASILMDLPRPVSANLPRPWVQSAYRRWRTGTAGTVIRRLWLPYNAGEQWTCAFEVMPDSAGPVQVSASTAIEALIAASALLELWDNSADPHWYQPLAEFCHMTAHNVTSTIAGSVVIQGPKPAPGTDDALTFVSELIVQDNVHESWPSHDPVSALTCAARTACMLHDLGALPAVKWALHKGASAGTSVRRPAGPAMRITPNLPMYGAALRVWKPVQTAVGWQTTVQQLDGTDNVRAWLVPSELEAWIVGGRLYAMESLRQLWRPLPTPRAPADFEAGDPFDKVERGPDKAQRDRQPVVRFDATTSPANKPLLLDTLAWVGDVQIRVRIGHPEPVAIKYRWDVYARMTPFELAPLWAFERTRGIHEQGVLRVLRMVDHWIGRGDPELAVKWAGEEWAGEEWAGEER